MVRGEFMYDLDGVGEGAVFGEEVVYGGWLGSASWIVMCGFWWRDNVEVQDVADVVYGCSVVVCAASSPFDVRCIEVPSHDCGAVWIAEKCVVVLWVKKLLLTSLICGN